VKGGRYELRDEMRDMHTYKAFKCHDKNENRLKFIKQLTNPVDSGFSKEAMKLKDLTDAPFTRRYLDVFQEAKLFYIVTPFDVVSRRATTSADI
jgi:hypothetical protein